MGSFKYCQKTFMNLLKNTWEGDSKWTRKVKSSESTMLFQKNSPCFDSGSRELQMISLAVDLAEKQLLEGTASSQVITHYLKLGSSREKLEQERLAEENNLARAKVRLLIPLTKLKISIKMPSMHFVYTADRVTTMIRTYAELSKFEDF